MKTIAILLTLIIIALIVTPVGATPPTPQPVDGVVILNGYTPWPEDLDELYRFIDTGIQGWTFTGKCPANEPMITWKQVKRLAALDQDRTGYYVAKVTEINKIIAPFKIPGKGTFKITENDLFGLIIGMGLYGMINEDGVVLAECKPKGDRVAFYGDVIQIFLNKMQFYVKR